MNPFALLHLKPSLVCSEEEIKEAFEQPGLLQDPQRLAAREALRSPQGKLDAWMDAHHIVVKHHTVINPSLMTLFSEISEITRRVDTLARQKVEAQSQLAQALLDKDLFHCQEPLGRLIRQLETATQTCTGEFPTLEQTRCPQEANRLLSTLKFLSKWREDLNQTYRKLF